MEPNQPIHPRPSITTVNYHCWKPCNMRCRHCFARFNDANHDNLPRAEMLDVVRELARGFERINFVGGEPTLCPWLVDALQLARDLGCGTSIVTNGATLVHRPALRDAILARVDGVGISIDSAIDEANRAIGRSVGRQVFTASEMIHLAQFIRGRRVGLKVNTVVQRANVDENFEGILRGLLPERWKILQVLPVTGQNDEDYASVAIQADEFAKFVERHRHLAIHGITLVPEDHEAMTGSYAMVDPGGYAYDNIDGRHHYSSEPVHRIGWIKAFDEVRLLPERFVARGGNYLLPGGRS